MVSCDVCEDWYHLRCVGITQTAAKSMKKYVCPVCTALKGHAEPLEAALAKVAPSSAVFCCLNNSVQGHCSCLHITEVTFNKEYDNRKDHAVG